MSYQQTQFGGVVAGGLATAIFVVSLICVMTAWHPIPLAVLVVLVVALFLFYSLTIEIEKSHLRCYFGTGLIGRRIPLTRIASAHAVRNRWYYGWGIRLTPHGWMFNVSGLDAVELRFTDGDRFRIGADNPQEVVRQIEIARTNPPRM